MVALTIALGVGAVGLGWATGLRRARQGADLVVPSGTSGRGDSADATGQEPAEVADGEGDAAEWTDVADAAWDGLGHLTTYRSAEDLGTTSAELVEGYRKQGDSLVRYAGYLDVCGKVWACATEGPGWVDVSVVSEDDGGSGSLVRTIRLEREEWEEASKE